jgi:RHS repeat-associated protein
MGDTSARCGFDGLQQDPLSGHYHPGNGYRDVIPVLMRFSCPDSVSPFGAGGINPYAWCGGDPVNRADPDGHMSWQAGLGIGVGLLGLTLAIFSAGASLAAAGSVMAALESTTAASLTLGTLGAISDVTAVASGVTETASPRSSAMLGWVSLLTGGVGAAHGLVTAGLVGERLMTRTAEAFSRGLSPMSDDISRAARVFAEGARRGSQAEAVSLAVPRSVRTMIQRYEQEAYEVVHTQLGLSSRRYGTVRLPEFGPYRRLVQRRPDIPVYSEEVRSLAPVPEALDQTLQAFYDRLGLTPVTRQFRVHPALSREASGFASLADIPLPPPPPAYSPVDLLAPISSYEQSLHDELLESGGPVPDAQTSWMTHL